MSINKLSPIEERLAKLEERVRTLYILASDAIKWREDHPEATEAMKELRDQFYLTSDQEARDALCPKPD